jgi:hypothetical protein
LASVPPDNWPMWPRRRARRRAGEPAGDQQAARSGGAQRGSGADADRREGVLQVPTAGPGTAVMGRLWANAPGLRVSPAQASRLGSEIPARATTGRARNRITFTGSRVRIAVLASPSGGPDETFRLAGMINPTLVVPVGSHVSIEIINTGPDTAHGLVITARGTRSSWMLMMTAAPRLQRVSAVAPRQPHLRRHACRDPAVHRQHAGRLPLPVPGARAPSEGHDRHVHRPHSRVSQHWREARQPAHITG